MWSLIPLLGLVFLCPTAFSQSSSLPSSTSSSSSIAPSNATSQRQNLLTTTITSVLTPSASGSSSASPTTLILTLTLNNTANPNTNSSNTNSTGIPGNGTLTNGTLTNTTAPWNATDNYLPFNVALDPAYGVLGAVLILSGIPVAVLGGKNRWSSLAIASGYTLMLFTLVLILRFGVEPALQPPSPNPPTSTLRGLYLLGSVISAIIGAGIGIFFFTFAKYWINAAGGFTFAWFLLATRSGGLVNGSVLGRWGLLGGVAVLLFIAGLWGAIHEHIVLLSTAFMGATALTLGIDCYTRAGLKEFYLYNLGFYDLFPSLNGQNYPLTQTMAVELGVLAAVFLVGAAIQFKVLGMLQKRLKLLRDEEEARIEAEEVSKAAERFKNVGAELSEWEAKHGNGPRNGPGSPGTGYGDDDLETKKERGLDRPNSLLPELEFDGTRRDSSTLSLLQDERPSSILDSSRRGKASSTFSSAVLQSAADVYGILPTESPDPSRGNTPTTPRFSGVEVPSASRHVASTYQTLASTSASPILDQSPSTVIDHELEANMKLLAEVQRARQEVRGSLDQLRAATPQAMTPVSAGDPGGFPGQSSRTTSPLPGLDLEKLRTPSPTYIASLDSQSRGHRLSSTSTRILDGFDLPSPSALPAPTKVSIKPPTEWEEYVTERKIVTPTAASPAIPTSSGLGGGPRQKLSSEAVVSENVLRARERREKTYSLLEPRVASDFANIAATQGRNGTVYSANERGVSRSTTDLRPSSYYEVSTTQLNTQPSVAREIIPSGSNALAPKPSFPRRSMTTDELAEKHRKRLSKLQEPVTKAFVEEEEVKKAKERWERQKKLEKAEMERREKEGVEVLAEPRGRARSGETRISMDEWRKSVVTSGEAKHVGSLPHPGPRPPRPQADRPNEGVSGLGGSRDRRMSSYMPPS